MKESNLIIFATYWNEIDWIKPSLKQIEKLNPKEVIICDGCFDPRVPNNSTDGTREVIKEWVSKRKNARMISAVRVSRTTAFCKMLRGHSKTHFLQLFSPARMKSLVLTLLTNIYRVNQALTFQKMITLSKEWNINGWFMCYDCDQFYSDDMIKKFIKEFNTNSNVGLLIGDELTFFEGFEKYTDRYEKRKYNNMPHKIFTNTNVIPTRGPVIEDFSLKSFVFNKFILGEFYINKVKSENVGKYFHYKFKFSHDRLNKGYALGDRKKPDTHKYALQKFKGTHPEIIRKQFKIK